MTRRLIAITALLLTVACPKTPAPDEPNSGDAVADATQAAQPAAAEVPLPEGWTGQGILVQRGTTLPPRAPEWARVTAEVTEREGKRYLVASGHAERIRNAGLARATAENRARAELARWTASDTVTGAMIVDGWHHPGTLVTFARVELEVPAEWIPGRPLPSTEQAQADPSAPAGGEPAVPATP